VERICRWSNEKTRGGDEFGLGGEKKKIAGICKRYMQTQNQEKRREV